MDSGLEMAASESCSWVALTVIQSTSTGGTRALCETGTVKFWNALSKRILSGYEASASGLTIIVTAAPLRARQAPIRPPTPPAPRIACRNWPAIRTQASFRQQQEHRL